MISAGQTNPAAAPSATPPAAQPGQSAPWQFDSKNNMDAASGTKSVEFGPGGLYNDGKKVDGSSTGLSPVVGLGVDTTVNTFNGFDAGIGADFGLGRVGYFAQDGVTTYDEYSLGFRYFFKDSLRFGAKATIPMSNISNFGKISFRMPLSLGVFGQFGKSDVTETVSRTDEVPTFTGIGEPDGTRSITSAEDVTNKASYWIVMARATIGLDAVSYDKDGGFRLSFQTGPEVGGGKQGDSSIGYFGWSLGSSAALMF